MAYYAARYAGPRAKAAFYLAVMMPLWSSYLVKIYGWKLLLAKEGAIGWIAGRLGLGPALEAWLALPLVGGPSLSVSYGTGSSKMSEYMALDIDTRKSDDKVLKVFVLECMRQTNTFMKAQGALALLKATCETQVKESARAVLMQSGNITRNTYESFNSLLKSTSRIPGRKLAFFVSDGFLMDVGPHGAELRDRLDHIIDSAQRGGVVVYTIHAKGLVSSFPDASIKQPVDERLDMAKTGEFQAYQGCAACAGRGHWRAGLARDELFRPLGQQDAR
jgi:hypothetical protein